MREKVCREQTSWGSTQSNPMTSATYLACNRVETVSSTNRGLHYGDGLFETLRVHHGQIPLWPQHRARLIEGAHRLGITLPAMAFLEGEMAALSANCEQGVLKLLLTRGDGGRGYAPPPQMLPVWQLSLHPLPQAVSALQLHLCQTRLAVQPALAGIKHCNRLEQVLARDEVVRAGCDEGLMQDTEGRVVSATSGNLLVYRSGRWVTPPVERCGVAGVLRGVLLVQGCAEVAELTLDDVMTADAVALCNAVRGILSVSRLGARQWPAYPAIFDLQKRLAMTYPMFPLSEHAA